MSAIYACENCGKKFTSDWSDEESLAEAVENFGGPPPPGTMATVCDDCYTRIMAMAEAENWPKRWTS